MSGWLMNWPHTKMTTPYPQWPPVLVTAGLGGTIAAASPDSIPLHPTMVNDPRTRARMGRGVDCDGIIRTCHRNLAAYSYLRPHKRTQYKGFSHAGLAAKNENAYFERHYDDYVPREMTTPLLKQSILRERENPDIPKWQGNALIGMEIHGSDDHAVFLPTGQLLQQACVYRTSATGEQSPKFSNVVETGTVIRQFEILGSRDIYAMYGDSSIRVAARGAANCTILRATLDDPGVDPRLDVLHRIPFSEMLYHVAGSPHTDDNAAFVTGDGKVHMWDSVGGLRCVGSKNTTVDERVLRCEFSSNPCVLWASNRVRVQSVDTRERASTTTVLFDLVKLNAPNSQIYAFKRRESHPFQIVVGSSVSIEVLDTRMPGKPLLSWAQREELNTKAPYFGVIGDVDWSPNEDRSDGGLILSSVQGRKTVSLLSLARPQATARSAQLSLAPLRSAQADQEIAPQYVTGDAPLDIQLRDGGEWTSMIGTCAVPTKSNVSVYLLNNMGDLYCQSVRPSADPTTYETSIQDDLPCGVTARVGSGDAHELPLPVDAILPEHDAVTLTPFTTAPIKILLATYPRLPEPITSGDDTVQLFDAIDSLAVMCRPSLTLFQLVRYVNDKLRLHVSPQTLARMLHAHSRFRVRNIYCRLRQPTASIVVGSNEDPVVSRSRTDPRLAVCVCNPETTLEPCESAACIVPHALIVTSCEELGTDGYMPTIEARTDPLAIEFAATLAQAQDLYGLKE